MKKEVVHYECDNCDNVSPGETVEPNDGIKRMPEEWAHVTAKVNGGTPLFDLDLCTKCMEVMRKALLRRNKK